MKDKIPLSEQANVPGGLMSLDPGTVAGQRPPNYPHKQYSRLSADDTVDPKVIVLPVIRIERHEE